MVLPFNQLTINAFKPFQRAYYGNLGNLLSENYQ